MVQLVVHSSRAVCYKLWYIAMGCSPHGNYILAYAILATITRLITFGIVLAAIVRCGMHMGYFLDYLLYWSVYIESDFLWSHLLLCNELISTVHFLYSFVFYNFLCCIELYPALTLFGTCGVERLHFVLRGFGVCLVDCPRCLTDLFWFGVELGAVINGSFLSAIVFRGID